MSNTYAQEIAKARLTLVERALIQFVEERDGRVPSDDEILQHGRHLQFSDTPMARYVQGKLHFTQYYLWRRRDLLALGFLDPNAPLSLFVCRVPDDQWPTAVRLRDQQLHDEK